MKNINFRQMACAVVLISTMALPACSNMNNRDQRMLSGAAIGTGAGAIIGAATGGSVLTGAAIGAAAGTAGGYIYDRNR